MPRARQADGGPAEAAGTHRNSLTFSRDLAVTWSLAPFYTMRSNVPFRCLLREFVAAEFASREMRRTLEGLLRKQPELAEFIDIDAPATGGPLARPELIFEVPAAWILTLHGGDQEKLTPLRRWKIPDQQFTGTGLRQMLTDAGLTQPGARQSPCPSTGGSDVLSRREHASIEVTSRHGACVLFDPIFRGTLLDCATSMPPPQPEVAATFVTHSHFDHFNLATLDYLGEQGTKIYVPAVPRHTMLAEDMYGVLGRSGLKAEHCKWGDLKTVGDITIETLPFYGEQPSARVGPAEPSAVNWGNCYRVDTDDFSAIVLSDSGLDPRGSMLDAIADSVSRRGPIDVVAGSLRSFYSPFEIEGLASYFSVLPVSGLRADHDLYRRGRLSSTTLGVSGVARACAEAGARFFLPYAHGFTGYGQPVAANPFGPGLTVDEAAACRELTQELGRIGCDTRVVDWKPGDSWTSSRA
jgi:L-ascorbate metabolism protein UlaG (beta-lactamase superfamily)